MVFIFIPLDSILITTIKIILELVVTLVAHALVTIADEEAVNL